MFVGIILRDSEIGNMYQETIHIDRAVREEAQVTIDSYIRVLNEKDGSNGSYFGILENLRDCLTVV